MKIKRYQHWSKGGLVWSKWFPWNGIIEEKWQMKNKQKNEYKDVSEQEWKEIEKQQDEEYDKKYKEAWKI